jgi:hypothetical protein
VIVSPAVIVMLDGENPVEKSASTEWPAADAIPAWKKPPTTKARMPATPASSPTARALLTVG